MKRFRNSLLVFAVAVGILGAVFFKVSALIWLLVLILVAGLSVFAYFSERLTMLNWLLLIAFAISSGFCFSLQREDYQRQLNAYRGLNDQNIAVTGVILQPPVRNESGSRFILRIIGPNQVLRSKIIVYSNAPVPAEWYGKTVAVNGKFKIAQFSCGYPGYYESRKLVGRISTRSPIRIVNTPSKLNPLLRSAYRLRSAMSVFGKSVLTPRNYSLLQGMIFGEDLVQEGEEGDLVERFRRTGTIHLLTVSGLHIGFVVAGLTLLLRLLKIPEKYRIVPLVVCVGFYMLMTGLEPPVVRAGLMFVLYMLSKSLGAGDSGLNRLSLAALIILFLNPYNLFAAGFQLSVLATLGVVWLFPVMRQYFPVKKRILNAVWQALLISISAQLMIIPLLIVYFNQVSWLAPLYNLILVLPANLTVSTGLLGELLGLWIPAVGKIILKGTDLTLHFIWKFMNLFGNLKWNAFWMPSWPLLWVISYYLILLLVLDRLKPNLLTGKRNWRFGTVCITLLLIANLLIWSLVYYNNQERCVEIVMLDVGQGDAILLRTPDGYTALVDGGDNGAGFRRILPYLRREGIDHLDYVFGTHGHQDHLGGLGEVLLKISANQFYLPENIDFDSVTVKKLLETIKARKFTKTTVSNGKKFRLGAKVCGRVFHLEERLDENNNSLVLQLQYGKNSILLTGDLGAKGEEILVTKYPHLLKATVLKVGHHGSDSSSTLRFISQVKPRVAMISAGSNNRYGHPGKKSLNRLYSLGSKVYRTDLHGTIKVKVYQDRLEIVTVN
ncbi:MAG TPA: DNA internalization-related competence protein ComEC/Rec2 [Bacillota bacterium]|nr:DNA internalization-related competence protein ComEC/Rec2 [Bacillota bacterium]HOL10682.1 DNA internalization-related competence protein ComEC/Rec2 [Bacillota bacterium]HPO98505.1 DNA internalization-related competence protein ComEC/Rec2 [Bacillota bacterium]